MPGHRPFRTLGAALALALALTTHVAAEGPGPGDAIVIFDFSVSTAWSSIDDVVMGGVSRSEMVTENGVAVFRGVLSLENSGGFASVRSRPAGHDLSGFAALTLRVRGDGKRYKLRLRTTDAFDGVSWEAPLETNGRDWEDVVVPLDAFRPTFRGRLVRDHPPLDPARVRTFGLMIADRQEGPFRLEIASIVGTPAEAD
jgi:NADH dehydrogenase [ubiquinone] 1 alpha subcomplex assembly factor 1